MQNYVSGRRNFNVHIMLRIINKGEGLLKQDGWKLEQSKYIFEKIIGKLNLHAMNSCNLQEDSSVQLQTITFLYNH